MKYSGMQMGKKWSATSLGDESCSRCGVCLTKMPLVLLSVLLCSSLTTGARLEIQKLDVPSIVDPRWESVSLRCEYDLGGKDLYSVTWYKDGQEFFNYKPSEPKRDRGIDGVYVDLGRSNSKQVTLLGPNYRGKAHLAGSYGCEVSSEGPSFETDYRQANMSVAVPPKTPPVLEGMRPSYEVGDILEAECTSGLSYPPAVLTFILNSEEVNRDVTKILQGGYTDESVISSTRLGLTMRLERHHFPGGTLNLTCQATLPGITDYKPIKTIEIATLAANNQRLVEPPRKSGSRSNCGPCLVLIIWIMATIHSAIRRDNLGLCV